MKEFFDIYIQEVENMSSDKVTIYTNPKNRKQLECMLVYLQGQMDKIQFSEEE